MSLGHGSKKSLVSHGGTPQLVLSLRQLYKYSGPILKIRRDSDDTTQTFSFSNDLYGIPIDDILTFVGAGSGYVETWYDQSGDGRHATNTTQAEQPRIVNSGALETKNDKPTVVFSGSQRLNVTTTTFGSSFSVFQRNSAAMVISETTSGGATYRGLFAHGADDLYWVHSDYAYNNGSLVNRSTTNSPTGAVQGSDLFQVTGVGTPDSQSVMIKTHALGYATPSYQDLIGSISELVVFPTDIRDKRSYIEQDQMEYYSI